MPGRMPTRKERAERTAYVARLWSSGLFKHEVLALAARKFGMQPRCVERYLCRARRLAVAQTKKPKDQLRGQALQRYLKIARGKDTSDRDRLRALERIDVLLGLEEPRFVHQNIKVAPAETIFDLANRPEVIEAASRLPAHGNGTTNGKGANGSAPDPGRP